MAASKLNDGVTQPTRQYPGTGENRAAKYKQPQMQGRPLPQSAKGGPNMYEQMGDGKQETAGVTRERDPLMVRAANVRDGANNGG